MVDTNRLDSIWSAIHILCIDLFLIATECYLGLIAIESYVYYVVKVGLLVKYNKHGQVYKFNLQYNRRALVVVRYEIHQIDDFTLKWGHDPAISGMAHPATGLSSICNDIHIK